MVKDNSLRSLRAPLASVQPGTSEHGPPPRVQLQPAALWKVQCQLLLSPLATEGPCSILAAHRALGLIHSTATCRPQTGLYRSTPTWSSTTRSESSSLPPPVSSRVLAFLRIDLGQTLFLGAWLSDSAKLDPPWVLIVTSDCQPGAAGRDLCPPKWLLGIAAPIRMHL